MTTNKRIIIFLFLAFFLSSCVAERTLVLPSREPIVTDKFFSFDSPAGFSGVFYFGGFYDFGSSPNDFSPSITFGSAPNAYSAHFLVVTGGETVDELIISVSGISIDDEGNKVSSDSENITIGAFTSVDSYFETSKKWVGVVTVEAVAGTPVLSDYGFAKYWDNLNTNFTIKGVEATWLGGANDASADIILLFHRTSGWVYDVSGIPTLLPAITSMRGDLGADAGIKNNMHGAWKRTDLDTFVHGNNGEGVIFKVVTSANKAFQLGNIQLSIEVE